MKVAFRFLLLFSINIFAVCYSHGQDSSSKYDWHVISKKLTDNNYELIFSTNGLPGQQLYAPEQSPGGVSTTELFFNDSSIRQIGKFETTGDSKSFVSPIFENTTVKIFEGKTEWKTTIGITGSIPAFLQGTLRYTYGNNDEFNTAIPFAFNVALEGGVISSTRIKIEHLDLKNPVNNCGDDDTAGKSLLSIFILGLIGGFIALLTPCVFPLIPLTVSYFTKKGMDRKKGVTNALIYGFFIFLIYVLLSLPFHIFLNKPNPEILNNISTNIWLNIGFFAVFVVFAISFFGYFEITLPGGLANRINTKSGIRNLGGIFFMALTLAIVSFSCTGPILGSLLAGTFTEGAWPLTVGLAGFGLALALPFALFAMFPGWLQSLPKSGGWLNTVKVVLGFLELALAIKFLSNADLVKQWGFLKREVFIGLWLLISICTLLYLLGKIRFPHDEPTRKLSRLRWLFVAIFTVITIYLIPGITNTKWANLRLISGFPPPLCYSIYKEPINCKRGFEPLKDYEEALQLARKENKPLLIDFTGWACVNCRRMEENVWTDPVVDSMMRKKFVVVSLYVDERRKLPLTQQLVFKTKSGDEKSIVTVGDKWATFQFENFNAVSQPQYAIIGTNERALTKTKGYTPGPDEFADWLRCGLDAFKKINPKPSVSGKE